MEQWVVEQVVIRRQSRCTVKVRPKELYERLDMGHKRNRGVGAHFEDVGLRSWMNGIAICLNRKAFEGAFEVFMVWKGVKCRPSFGSVRIQQFVRHSSGDVDYGMGSRDWN